MTLRSAPDGGGALRVRPDAGQYWSGAAATAVVAALVALVGILICRWTLGIPILAPAGDGAWGDARTGVYVLAAACTALVAAALLYLLMLGTPQPGMFFGWIIGLATLAAVVYPFSTGAPLAQKMATAVVDLALGIAIGSLLGAVAARGTRRVAVLPDEVPYEHERYEHERYEDGHEHPTHPPTLPNYYPPSRTPGE